MHKVTPHASAQGETVEESEKKHTLERGHGANLDQHPEKHFEAHPKGPRKNLKHKGKKPHTSSHHHETEEASDVPGVFLEEQQFIMPPPKLNRPSSFRNH